MTGNIIQRNRGSNIVHFDRTYGESQIAVFGNVFRDNNVTNTNSGGTIAIGGGVSSFRYNIFENPNILYQVRILMSSNNPPLDVRYNWWGSSNELDVAMTIWDFYYDYTRAKADYIPYLLGPSIDANATNHSELSFNNFNVLRGTVNENYTLPSNEIFNMTGTLLIPRGIQLVIQQGVTIYCHAYSGIILTVLNTNFFDLFCQNSYCCGRRIGCNWN
jgi:hypothetical protein